MLKDCLCEGNAAARRRPSGQNRSDPGLAGRESPPKASSHPGSIRHSGQIPPVVCGEARNKGSDSILMHLDCQMLRFPLEEQHHVETSGHGHDGACGIFGWSNGQTEGQVTKLKLVKRQMYAARTSISFAQGPSASHSREHQTCVRAPFARR